MDTSNHPPAQVSDEPMRAAPVKRTENGFIVHHRLESLVREYGTLDLRSQRRRDVMAEIYEIAVARGVAAADVERGAVLEEVALHFDAKVLMCNPAYVAEFVRGLKSATKGAKPHV